MLNLTLYKMVKPITSTVCKTDKILELGALVYSREGIRCTILHLTHQDHFGSFGALAGFQKMTFTKRYFSHIVHPFMKTFFSEGPLYWIT